MPKRRRTGEGGEFPWADQSAEGRARSSEESDEEALPSWARQDREEISAGKALWEFIFPTYYVGVFSAKGCLHSVLVYQRLRRCW